MRRDLGWSVATIVSAREVALDIREIVLRPLDGARPAPAGSHLDVKLDTGDVRSYSLIGAPDGCYRIAVKLAADGRGGSRRMWQLERGKTIEVTSPIANFDLGLDAPEHLLIAGGIGITALHAMALALATRPGSTMRMHYAAPSRAHMAFVDELAPVLGSRLRLHPSDEGDRLDLAAVFATLHPLAEVYLCGPMRLLEGARSAWAAAGRSVTRLRFETFGSSGLHANQPFNVRLPRLGMEVAVPAHVSLLDALEDAGVGVLADCRRGECGLCLVDVIGSEGGELDHRDVFLSAGQRAEGRKMCACVSRQAGGTLVLDPPWRGDISLTV